MAELPLTPVGLSTTATTLTHCPYCALQCGMTLTADSDHRLRVGTRGFPTNRGGLCRKGWTSAALLTGDRLLAPLVRTADGTLQEATWDDALDRVVTSIATVQAEHGADAVGMFGGGGLTNEKAYAFGKFARVALQTKSIDYNGRFCMSSAAAAGHQAFGLDRGLPFPLSDIADTDLVLLVGSNVAETMPPAMQWVSAAGSLIVIDPRRTPTAQAAAVHLQPLPGTDLVVAMALLHSVIALGAADEDYIARRTQGWEQVRAMAALWWPERAERVCGIAARQLREVAARLAAAPTAMILTARGTEQHATGVDMVLGWTNLALALGLVGRPYSGFGTITGQGNGQGGREHGQKADQLPGYRRLANAADRAHVAAVWGIEPDQLPQPGPSAYELLSDLGEGIKALIISGSNPVVSAPRAGYVTERLASLDLLVVCDLVLSETAAMADVVLPIAQWAEEDGTMTNLEGRVLLRRRATEPPPGVRTDLEVLHGLAERLGCGEKFPTDARTVFEELRRASAGGLADYAGITWERIAADDGVFWPCPSLDHPGTPRLFTDTFATADGLARFHPVEPSAPSELTDEHYPLWLTTGRVLAHYQSGAQTRRVRELATSAPQAFCELHPALAQTLGITDGQSVRLTTRRGEATFAARLTDSIRSDTLFAPFHWAGAQRANSLTDPALDPISRMPAFKVCAVRLEVAS